MQAGPSILNFEVRPKDDGGWLLARCEYRDNTYYCQERTYEELQQACKKLAENLAACPMTVQWTFNDSYKVHPTTTEFYLNYLLQKPTV